MARPTKPPIDDSYYRNYAGSGRSYDSVYRDYSYSEECAELFSSGRYPRPKSLLVLGPATGRVLQDFHRDLGVKAWGCEISEWAWERIPAEYRARVARASMIDYLSELRESGARLDLCFTNALGYLATPTVDPVLNGLAHSTRYVHFRSSFLGAACPDPYRQTLKPYAWWVGRFEAAGFKTHFEADGSPLYLWESLR